MPSSNARRDLLQRLLQDTYFDNIDQGDATAAVEALHEEVEWVHTQVWEHHGHTRDRPDALRGRDAVRRFLAARIDEMQHEGIRHKVCSVIADGDTGAFRAEVVGPEGVTLAFLGWVELKDDKIHTYIVAPER